jgi:hypothetical protein
MSTVISVEPAADFGMNQGILIVSDSWQPDRVVIEQADRVIYILDEWMESAADGEIPWARITHLNPWRRVLKIRGTDRMVIYEEIGGCGPRVIATLLQQPD